MADDGIRERQRTSFGATAPGYDAQRPEWPAGTAAWLTGTDQDGPLVGRRLRVLDVGAGTGKLTRTLVAAGHDVVVADPSPGMLDVLRDRLPDVEAHVAPAERLPLPAASVDAVTAAQAWHWFDGAAAAAECARVLRPGGVLGVGWHIKDQREPWVGELGRLVDMPDDGRDGGWTAPVAALGAFGPAERAEFRYEQRLTPDDLVTLAGSWSYVAVRPDREAVLTEVRALAARWAGADGRLALPHVTRCWRFVRAG